MIVTKPPHRGTEPAVDLLAGDKSVWPDDLGRDVRRNDDLGGRIGVAPAVTSGPAADSDGERLLLDDKAARKIFEALVVAGVRAACVLFL